MTSDDKLVRPMRTRQVTWFSDRLVELLQASGMQSLLEEGVEIVRRRRAGDLQVSKGGFSVRITLDKMRPVRVRLTMNPIPMAAWIAVAESLSPSSRVSAAMLNNDLPEEIESACSVEGYAFIPGSSADFEFACECGTAEICIHRAALSVMLSDKLEADSGLYLLFRGIEREAFLQMLREARRRREPAAKQQESVTSEQIRYERSVKLQELIPTYWDARQGFNALHYDIKADDLPASLFRRLDPLPIGEVNTTIELALEDLYASVASRAQVLGLGL